MFSYNSIIHAHTGARRVGYKYIYIYIYISNEYSICDFCTLMYPLCRIGNWLVINALGPNDAYTRQWIVSHVDQLNDYVIKSGRRWFEMPSRSL